MPKPPPQPFYRKALKSYYVKLGGKFIHLGKDRDNAYAKYHGLMLSRQPTLPETPVEILLGKFLSWCQLHREPLTYEWYLKHLKSFRVHVGPTLTIANLKAFHVTDWMDLHYKGSGDNYRNGACRAVMRAFNWGVKQGHIGANPVKGVEKPRAHGRIAYLHPHQWTTVLAKVRDADPFKDFLRFMRATGCRPQEARAAETRHFDRQSETLVFPVDESKGKREPRIIPLNAEAMRIISRLVLKYPDGKLFRNTKGRHWTKNTVTSRFTKLREKLGFEFFAYAIRHTFITDALRQGCNPVTLAHIVGHKDATMILKVYQHLNLNRGHVRAELALATGETPERKAVTA